MLVCPKCNTNRFNIKLVKKSVVELVSDGENTVMNILSIDEQETSVFDTCVNCGLSIEPEGTNLIPLVGCSFCGETTDLNEDGVCSTCVLKRDELLGLDTLDLIKKLIQLEKQTGISAKNANTEIDLVAVDEVI